MFFFLLVGFLVAGSPWLTIKGQGRLPSWLEWVSLCICLDLFAWQVCPWVKGPPLHPMEVGRADVFPFDCLSVSFSLLLSLLLLLQDYLPSPLLHTLIANVRFTSGHPQSSLLPFKEGGRRKRKWAFMEHLLTAWGTQDPLTRSSPPRGVGVAVPFDSLGFYL